MSRISELLSQLNNIPKGYISKKKIHGDVYYYFQYRKDGKNYSKYISLIKLNSYREQIAYRKKLEEELKSILNSGKALPELSRNARELSGNIMMNDIKVASFDKGILTYLDKTRAPLSIVKRKDIRLFLSARVVDNTRRNSRILKRILLLNNVDDEMLSLYAHGAVITDNYWFKSKGSRLKYRDIVFEQDFYYEAALEGIIESLTSNPRMTPQITLGGSYEKCWRKINNEWWIYKKGNRNELFSEMFSSRLANSLKIPTVKYELTDGYIRCKNFADKYNFEPLTSLVGDDYSYEKVFETLYSINKIIARQYLLLTWFDALVFNFDRHNENCGLMRNKRTGEIVALSPNFDNNLSLVAYQQTLKRDNKDDVFLRNYIKFLKKHPQASKLFGEIKLPKLTRDMINNCLINLVCPVDVSLLTDYLLNRYHYLTNF